MLALSTFSSLRLAPAAACRDAFISAVQLKSRAAEAARYLARLQEAHPDDVAANPGLVPLLSRVMGEGPGLPAAGAAMGVLARICLTPQGRARVQAGAALSPAVR
jgi:hypothetical protein